MDEPSNSFIKIGVILVFVVPLASLALHFALKPKTWTPSLIILAGSILALAVGEYAHSGSLLFAVRNGVAIGFLFFLVSVVIGLVVRLFFWRTYAAGEKRDMQGPAWRRHSRVLGAVAMVFGVTVLVLGWTVFKDFELKGSILAAVSFYLAYKYWRSPGGAASVSQWLLEGKIGRENTELSNSMAESDARKTGARRSP
jgi:hypothetical protein